VKKIIAIALIAFSLLLVAAFKRADAPAGNDLLDGFRIVEVASVADAMEQLYGTKAYMYHDMRPLATAKFVGPAVTVMLKKEEHHEGSKAIQGMLDAIDDAPAGSVYVMVVEDGLDYDEYGNEGARAGRCGGGCECARYAANCEDSVSGFQQRCGTEYDGESLPVCGEQCAGEVRWGGCARGGYYYGGYGWRGGGAD
jgi:hypothetical protein